MTEEKPLGNFQSSHLKCKESITKPGVPGASDVLCVDDLANGCMVHDDMNNGKTKYTYK